MIPKNLKDELKQGMMLALGRLENQSEILHLKSLTVVDRLEKLAADHIMRTLPWWDGYSLFPHLEFGADSYFVLLAALDLAKRQPDEAIMMLDAWVLHGGELSFEPAEQFPEIL
tara:strand:+ start:5671 stop:6012 length:342 start_codon:yes stop_codon:yes gene_type:complete